MSFFCHLRFCEHVICSVLTFLPASLTVRRMEMSMVQSLLLKETPETPLMQSINVRCSTMAFFGFMCSDQQRVCNGCAAGECTHPSWQPLVKPQL